MSIQNNKYVINLDVDGGDNAPSSVLNGAELYLKDNQNVRFNLYGRKSIIDFHIKNLPLLLNFSNITISAFITCFPKFSKFTVTLFPIID